jgi:protocatechuate 3,4-dioxygenase beta subunit
MRKLGVGVIGLGLVVAAVIFVVRGVVRWRSPTPPSAASAPAAPATTRPAPAANGPALAQLGGDVLDQNGAPVEGAMVRLAATAGGPDAPAPVTARTGPGGTFRLDDVPPGRWAVAASALGFLPAQAGPIDLGPGAATPLHLRLEAGGRTVSGTVSDRTGGPIAGALVEVTPLHGLLAARDERVAAALSDASGRYQASVGEGRVRVDARHPDYVGDSRAVEVGAAGAKVDFALVPGGVIEGVVRTSGSGEPVGDAEVTCDREATADVPYAALAVSAGLGTVRADAAGKFRLTGLAPGALRLRARAPGRASLSATVVPLGVAVQVSGVELFVGGAYAVRGQVELDDGAPAAAAHVVAQSPLGRVATSADANGRFTLNGLPPGPWRLRADTDDTLPADRPTRVLVKDADVDGVRLTLQRGVFVDGKVEPAEVAEVGPDRPVDLLAGPALMAVAMVSTLSAPDGTFRMGPLAPGALTLTARAADGRSASAQLDVPPAGAHGVVLRLEAHGGIAGRVVDTAGQPVVGAVVRVKRAGTGETVIVNGQEVTAGRAAVGAEGRYLALGLPAGSYELAVTSDDGEPLTLAKPAPPVALEADTRREGVDLTVEARDGVIRGTVLGPDGAALADAWVTVSAERAPPHPEAGPGPSRRVVMIAQTDDDAPSGGVPPTLTDASGRFEVRGLRRGAYRVAAAGKAGTARGRLEGVATGSDVTLRLALLRALEGIATLDGKPVGELTVTLTGGEPRSETFHDADGKFRFERVDPGAYTVRVTAAGGGSGEAAVTVADAPETKVAVALVANGRVTGRVVGADGKPVAGAPVVLAPFSPGGRLQIAIEGEPQRTDAQGGFSLEAAPGKQLLVVLGGAGPLARKPVEVSAGGVADLGELVAEPPAGPGPGPAPGPAPAHKPG